MKINYFNQILTIQILNTVKGGTQDYLNVLVLSGKLKGKRLLIDHSYFIKE